MLTTLLIAILAKSSYLEFYPERKAMLWFPDGKDSIESMLKDRDHVHATLQNRIIAIENIQKIVSIFSDKNFQTSVEQFRNNIMKGHTMVVTEVQEYFNRVDEYGLALSSVLKSVESKAIRAGRFEETKPILEALKLLDDDINKLKKNVFTMKVSLSNFMPILIEQTKEFRHLLQNDRLEIRSVIGDHKNILTDLAKNEDKIKLSIAAVGTIIGEKGMNEHTDELIDVLEGDELTAKFKGIIGAVGAGGLVPLIWRGSMLLFSPLVAGPAFLGASAIVIGTGLLNFNQQLEKQKDSHNYQVELNKLNNVMSNLNIAIKQYEKALAGQKLAREKSQQALNDISAHLGEHLNIRNSFLPIQVKTALFYEIDKLLNNYNRMINFLEIQTLIQSSNKRIY